VIRARMCVSTPRRPPLQDALAAQRAARPPIEWPTTMTLPVPPPFRDAAASESINSASRGAIALFVTQSVELSS
jgi:hypothetical protein